MTDYNANIPQSGDFLSTSQGQILNNFGMLDSIFGNDHYEFDSSSTSFRGFHYQVSLPNQVTDVAAGAGLCRIYGKTVNSVVELFYRSDSGSGGKIAQLTNNGFLNLPATNSTNGTIKMGAIRICWGQGTLNASSALGSVTFATAFSATPYSCTVSVYASPVSDSSRGFGLQAGSLTSSGFTAQNYNSGFGSNTTFFYTAIGPA